MKKKNISLLSVVVSTLLLLTACGNPAAAPTPAPAPSNTGNSGSTDTPATKPNYTFKLGHEVQTVHLKHMVAEKFKEELDTRSGGRMKVEIFPAAQLGKEKEMVQQVQTGTLDLAIISNGYMSGQSESLNGWFLPFLFSDLKGAADARKLPASEQMLKDLDSQGIVGLDYLFAGNRHVLLKSGTIENLDEVKGKKLRVPASPLFEQFWKSVGAGPTPIPLPEVYMALQTGVIDGVDIDINALVSQKFYETAKNLTLTNHMAFPEIAMMSKTVFNQLDAEDQKIVMDAMSSAIDWGIQEAVEEEQAKIEELKQNGVNIAEFSNTDALKPIIESIYKEYSDKNPVIKAFVEQNNR